MINKVIDVLTYSGNAEVEWILADNTPAMVTVNELKEALVLAGIAQHQEWKI